MSEQAAAPADLDLRLARLRAVPAGSIEPMKRSLERKGQLSALLASAEDGKLVLIDGFKRQAAALALEWPALRVEVAQLSAVESKAQLYLRHRDSALSLIEEAMLVQELYRLDGLNQVEIGELLERHKSWVCRRLQLIEGLSPYLLEDIKVGLVGPASARQLARLPACNQAELAVPVVRHKLGGRQSAELIELWRRAPDEIGRRFVLTHPLEALALARGETAPAEDPRLTPRARELLRSLRIIRSSAERLCARCEQGVDQLSAEGRVLIDTAYREAVEAAARAWVMVEALTQEALSVQ